MKKPFSQLLKASRLARKGRPLSAALVVASLGRPPKPKRKRAQTIAKRPSPPSAPPRRPPAGSFVAGRFDGPGGERTYKLYTPRGSMRRRLPLVVMLHGCGQTAADFAIGTGMNRLADELGFLVLYPEQSLSASLARCWNWQRPGDQKRGLGEPAAIAGLTREIMLTCKANPARVYVCGMSAGGAAAAILASTYPELYLAAGVHSGPARENVSTLADALGVMRNGPRPQTPTNATRHRPAIVFHGDQDAVVHPSNAARFLSQLQRSSRRPLISATEQGRSHGGRAYTRTVYRHDGGEALLEEWTVHGAGHGWSGGSGAGSHTDPAGPDASREMMRFFLARKRPAPKPRAKPLAPPKA